MLLAHKTSKEVHNQIRGMYPFPVAYTTLDGEIIKICESRLSDKQASDPGKIINIYDDGLGVSCIDKEIIITKLKPSGKKEMSAKDYINGKKAENLKGKILC